MNNEDFFHNLFSNAVNQSLTNQAKSYPPMPTEQKEALDKILNAIHDIFENEKKVTGLYRVQLNDAIVLKIASELGWLNGGIQ